MPTLQDIRRQVPELEGLDDESAITALQQAYYPTVPFETLAAKLGYKPAAPAAPQSPGLMRSTADTGVALAKAGAIGVKMLSDAFGADNPVSRTAGGAIDWLQGLESNYSKWEQQQSAKEMDAAAESGSAWEQIKAAGSAFARRPIDFTAEAVGTSLPTLATAFLPGGQGVALVRIGAMLGLGSAQGAGAIKGQIFDAVKQEWVKAGASEAEANDRALKAQEYLGSNQGQIALGTALGAAAGVLGAEASILGRRVVENAAKPAATSLMGRAAESLPGRVGLGALKEGIPEAAQGGQEQFAQNSALNNEGFNVDPWKGVVGNAALEALAGGAMGGAVEIMPVERQQPQQDAPPKEETLRLEATKRIAIANSVDEAVEAFSQATAPVTSGRVLTPRQANIDAIGEIRQLDPAQQQEALDLLNTARRPDVSGAVRRFAMNRLDEMLLPVRQPDAPGEATELPPIGDALELEDIPAGEATELSPSLVVDNQRFRTPQEIADEGRPPIPVGDATEIEEVQPAPPVTAPDQPREPRGTLRTPELDLSGRLSVRAYVDRMRGINTLAARAFVKEYEAGRITDDDVMSLIAPTQRREPTADERLAAAAGQATPPQGIVLPVGAGPRRPATTDNPVTLPASGAQDDRGDDPPDDVGGAGGAGLPGGPRQGGPGGVAPDGNGDAPASADRAGRGNSDSQVPPADTTALGGYTDLKTGDGMPYGTRSGAAVRAKKEGGEVIEVDGGWVVRVGKGPTYTNTKAPFDGSGIVNVLVDAQMGAAKLDWGKDGGLEALKTSGHVDAKGGITPKGQGLLQRINSREARDNKTPKELAGEIEAAIGLRTIRTEQGRPAPDVFNSDAKANTSPERVDSGAEQVAQVAQAPVAQVAQVAQAPAAPPAAPPSRGTEPPAAPPPRRTEARGTARHPRTVAGSSVLAMVSESLGGLDPTWLSEFSSRQEINRIGRDGRRMVQWRNPLIPGVGRLFRKGGTQDLHQLAELMEDAGYLEPGSVEADTYEAGQRAKEMVREALQGDEPLTWQGRLSKAQQDQAEDALVELDWLSELDDGALDDAGYTDLAPDVQQATAELLAAAEAMGLDTESLVERAAMQSDGQTQDAYHAALQDLARQAIEAAGQDAGGVDAEAAGRGDQGGGQPDGGQEGPEEGLTPEAPTAPAQDLNTDPAALPAGVRDRLQAGIDRLGGIREDLQAQLDGRGHGYTFKLALLERLPDIRKARESLNEFRRHAERNGFDAEAIIAQLGGDVNLEPFVVNDKPVLASLPNEERLLCMSCGEDKLDRPASAGAMYQGPMWQTLRTHMPQDGIPNMLVLSAKYGMVDQGTQLQPYNQRLTPERQAELVRDMADNVADLERSLKGKEINEVLLVGGADYRATMAEAVADLMARGLIKPGAVVNAIEGSFLQQRKALGEYLRALPGSTPAEAEAQPQAGGELDLEGGEFTGRQWVPVATGRQAGPTDYQLKHNGKTFVTVKHAGHQTALRPYYLQGPGVAFVAPEMDNRKFSTLAEAKRVAEQALDQSLAGTAPPFDAAAVTLKQDGKKWFIVDPRVGAPQGPIRAKNQAEADERLREYIDFQQQAAGIRGEPAAAPPADANGRERTEPDAPAYRIDRIPASEAANGKLTWMVMADGEAVDAFNTKAEAQRWINKQSKADQDAKPDPEGLVVVPADEDAFGLAMSQASNGTLDSADRRDDVRRQVDGESQRYAATFKPDLEPVSLPRVTSAKPKPDGVAWLSPAEAKERLESWKDEADRQGGDNSGGARSRNSSRTVISLFDVSGQLAQPWIDAGYNVVTYDLQTGADINEFNAENLLDQHGNDEVWAILAQPPCTDFASSGAQFWKRKDEDGRTEASNELVRQTLRTVELFRPPVWVMENPVGRIQRLNQLPDPLLQFDPWHFGDNYTKRTLLWGNFNNSLPMAPVNPTQGSKMHKLSSSAKYERSLTPEGFAYAFFMANNAEGMPQGLRMSREFPGIEPQRFDAALAAGKTESDIRDEIEDSFYDNDLDYVRQLLDDMADDTPGRADEQNQAEAEEDAQDAEGNKIIDGLSDEKLKEAGKKLDIGGRNKPDTLRLLIRARLGRDVAATLEVLRAVAGKPGGRDDVIVSMRKQKSVLTSLLECLNA